MAIEFWCQGCGKPVRVAGEHGGKPSRCPVCQTVHTAPQRGGAASVPSSRPAADNWYLQIPDGRVFGPVEKGELDRWLSDGRISAECRVRLDKVEQWTPAAEIYPELRHSAIESADPPVSPVGIEGESPTSSSPFAPSASTTYTTAHRGGLILALGVAGLIVTCPVFSILAWVMGSADLRDMHSGKMDPAGRGLTQTGRILGMILTLVFLAVFVAVMFALVFLAARHASM